MVMVSSESKRVFAENQLVETLSLTQSQQQYSSLAVHIVMLVLLVSSDSKDVSEEINGLKQLDL